MYLKNLKHYYSKKKLFQYFIAATHVLAGVGYFSVQTAGDFVGLMLTLAMLSIAVLAATVSYEAALDTFTAHNNIDATG